MILDDYIMDSNIIMVIELFKNEILFFVCWLEKRDQYLTRWWKFPIKFMTFY